MRAVPTACALIDPFFSTGRIAVAVFCSGRAPLQLFCSVGNVLEMHMDIVTLIINLISGAVGGNVAGAAMKDKSLGPLLNSVVGVLGGGAGMAVLRMMGMAVNEGGLDLAAVVANIASGGVGGGILMIIVALIKGMMKKTAM